MSTELEIFDRRLLARRRDRAAAHANECDFLLQRVADDVVERLDVVRRQFPVVLNLGAHHGLLGRGIRRMPGVSMVIDADLSPRLVAQCPRPRLVADEEFLPFREASLDLVLSGLSLQFVNDLPGALLQIRRALKPDGLFLAAMLGGQTLGELRHAFLLAEDEVDGGASPRVAPFADVRDLGGLLQRAGFALPVADLAPVIVRYADPFGLFRDLRAMGLTNALVDRRRTPLRRSTL